MTTSDLIHIIQNELRKGVLARVLDERRVFPINALRPLCDEPIKFPTMTGVHLGVAEGGTIPAPGVERRTIILNTRPTRS